MPLAADRDATWRVSSWTGSVGRAASRLAAIAAVATAVTGSAEASVSSGPLTVTLASAPGLRPEPPRPREATATTCLHPARTGCAAGADVSVSSVRLTQFWELMDGEFGSVRAASLARDHVFADLDGQTVQEALAAGRDPKDVWRAVCVAFDVPPERR